MTGNGVEIDRKKTGNRQGMGRNRPETGRKGVETERKQAENG